MIASNSKRFVVNGDKFTEFKCAFGSRKEGKLESRNTWFCGREVASGCQLLLIHAEGSRLIVSLPLCSVLGIGHAKHEIHNNNNNRRGIVKNFCYSRRCTANSSNS